MDQELTAPQSTPEELQAAFAGIAAALGHLTLIVSALQSSLLEKKVLSPALIGKHLDHAASEEWAKKLAVAIETLGRDSSLVNVLRGYQGTIQ